MYAAINLPWANLELAIISYHAKSNQFVSVQLC